MTFLVDETPTPARHAPLWWHTAGKQYTATGYGRKIPTEWMVQLENRWRRVYCCIFSNSGTCYVEGVKQADGKRPWRVVRGEHRREEKP